MTGDTMKIVPKNAKLRGQSGDDERASKARHPHADAQY